MGENQVNRYKFGFSDPCHVPNITIDWLVFH